MTRRIRLLVVDDHPVVRDGLKGMLSSQPDFELVGEAADGEEAVTLTGKLGPDVVLMDLRMPGVDGVSATSLIRERWPQVRVLVLTTYDADADIVRAVEAGATSYILKDAPRDDLFRAVRSTAEGKPYLSPPVAARLMGRLRAGAQEALTEREIEVLTLVARGESNKRIAHHLKLSEATVKSHLLHIYAKLGASDRTHAVTLALRAGILRLEE